MTEGASLGLEAYFDGDHVANGRRGEEYVVRELADSWRWAEEALWRYLSVDKKGV